MTSEERQKKIKEIAESWTDGVDLKDMLRTYYANSLDELTGFTDEELQEEYENIFGEETEETIDW